jgi:uncharacterized membrane protein YfcA
MLGLGVQGRPFVATATAIGIVVDVFRMPVYLITGSDQMLHAWPAVATLTIGVVFGTLLGERILRKMPERIFRRVVAVILLGIGIYLLLTPRR